MQTYVAKCGLIVAFAKGYGAILKLLTTDQVLNTLFLKIPQNLQKSLFAKHKSPLIWVLINNGLSVK